MTTSRREFLATGAGLLATFAPLCAAMAAPPSGLQGFVTSGAGQRFAPLPPLTWREGMPAPGAPAVTMAPQDARQTLLGFGSAFTEATCVVLARMPAPARTALLRELYGPGGLGLSLARSCIGASDYATELYSYDEGPPDPALSRFSIDHDRKAVLPMLRALQAVNPQLYLFASPWSPPGWMKYGGSMLGGSIKPQSLAAYAAYIGRYLDAYAAEGVRVRAVTVQNETDADQAGRMPACSWAQETEDDYIVKHLGPELARRGGATKLWILDHNYDLWGRALDQLDKPEVRALVDAVAWHGYVGAPDKMSRVHAAHPDLGVHWTEGGAMIDAPDYLTDWSKWAAVIAGVLDNRAQSFTTWNAALDEAGRPNIGPFTCGGIVTVRSDTHAVQRSGLYYALGHYARAFRRGDRIVGSEATGPGLTSAAARSPDGVISLVVSNPGAARMVAIASGGRTAAYQAPADSITTLRWAA